MRGVRVVFAMDTIGKSIFLAGPTPRSDDVSSWRPEAISVIEALDFNGRVFVPESSDWRQRDNYDGQVAWEWEALNAATVVVFWIPRDMDTLPGFTTNVEFGYLAASGKALLGFPSDAPKTKYLEDLAIRHCVPVFHSLKDLLAAAVVKANSNSFGLDKKA